jgi:hypothetical protein
MLRANSIIEVSSNATLHVAEMEDWVIMWSGSGSSVDIEMILGASSNITVDNGTITIGSDASLASLVIYGNSSINTTGTLVVQSLEVTSSFFADIRSTGTMDIYDVDITGSNIVAFTSSAGSIEIGSSNTDTYDCYEIVFNANNTLYWRSTGENCYLTRFVATADDLNINGFRHDTFLGRWFPGGYLRPGYMPVTYEISCNTIAAGYLSPSYDSIIVCNQYNASAWGFNYPSSVLLTINHKLVMSDDHGTKSFYTPQSPEVAPSNKVLFGTPNLGVGGLYKPPATVSVSRG